MGMIFIKEKAGKSKRKPGWQKAAQEYAEWQSKIASMSSGISGVKTTKTIGIVKKAPVQEANILQARYVIGSGTKAVARPEIKYHDDPEMLARELAARAVKHNAAPAYNKGPDMMVTEEELANLLRSNKRRS